MNSVDLTYEDIKIKFYRIVVSEELSIKEKILALRNLNCPNLLEDLIKDEVLNLHEDEKILLVLAINDKDKIIDFLKNSSHFKDSYLKNKDNSNFLKEIVILIDDLDIIREILFSNKNLSNYNKMEILKVIKNPELIQEFLKDNINVKSLNVLNNSISELRKIIKKHVELIPNIVERVIFVEKLIRDLPDLESNLDLIFATEDLDFIDKYFNKYLNEKKFLTNEDIVIITSLITGLENSEYIQKKIEDLNNNNISGTDEIIMFLIDDLIKNSNDKERNNIIDKYLYHDDILSPENKLKLIMNLDDKNLTLEYIKNLPEDYEILLHINQVLELLPEDHVGYNEENKRYLENFKKNIKKYSTNIKPNIPDELNFGIEIESESDFKINKEKLLNLMFFPKEWKLETEFLDNGFEVVSPILNNSEENIEKIYNICSVLNNIDQEITEKCGGHIHFDADYILQDGELGIIKLFELYLNVEDLLYIITNPENTVVRKDIERHAKPVLPKIYQLYNNGNIKINNEDDFTSLIKNIQNIQYTTNKNDRKQSINITNIGDENKNTIEFRLPNGTINPNDLIKNINLFGSILKTSRIITNITNKMNNKESLDEKEQNFLNSYNKIKDTNISDKNRLNLLLEMMFETEEERNIYQKRYDSNINISENKKFIEGNFRPRKVINIDLDKIKEGYSITTNEIGKTVLSDTNFKNINDVGENIKRKIAELMKKKYFERSHNEKRL